MWRKTVFLNISAIILFTHLFANPPQQYGIDIDHYAIQIVLSDSSDDIAAKTIIDFFRSPEVRTLRLDFAEFAIDSVLLNGKIADSKFENSKLDITLPVVRDTTISQVEITYHGKPADGLIGKNNKFGRRTFFVDNWPNRAHFWFPCIDHPRDKASVSMRITAPERFKIVANGPLTTKQNNRDGNSTWFFSSKQTMPVYCMVFGAAEFSTMQQTAAGQLLLSYWFFPKDSAAVRNFRNTPQMLAYYSNRFGVFPFEKLALVQANTRFGGMENAGAIFFNEKNFGGRLSFEVTVAHEIVHQWFGNWITPAAWNHLWLSEGFASYFGIQFFEKYDKSRFWKLLENSRDRYLRQQKWHEQALTQTEPANLFDMLNANNYTKGLWVVHMLRNELGDSFFWQSMQAVGEKFGGKNWTTEDLQMICEAQSGRQLGWFFDQWVHRGSIPRIVVRYFQDDSAGLQVQIEQKQSPATMRLPVDITIIEDGEQHDYRVVCRRRVEFFSWPLRSSNIKIVVDRNIQLLAGIKLVRQKFTSKNN